MSDSDDSMAGGFVRPKRGSRPKREDLVVDVDSSGEDSEETDFEVDEESDDSDVEVVQVESASNTPTSNGNMANGTANGHVNGSAASNNADADGDTAVTNENSRATSEDHESSIEEETTTKRKRRAPAKKKVKKEDDGIPNAVKHFNRMESGLKEFHPELRSVFEDSAEDPPSSTAPVEQPEGMSTRLLPFQLEGLGWLIRQERESKYHGGISADEMGMGKTIQTIALFSSDNDEKSGPISVIAPTVAVMQWKNEIRQYTGERFSVCVYHGANRTNDVQELKKSDIILTTYAVVESVYRKQVSGFTRKGSKVKEKSALHNIEFHRVVLDEAHNIKDRQAGTSRAVFMSQSKYRSCLSGTPLQNRIGESYSLLRFLRVEPFCKYFCTKCDCTSDEWRVERQKCIFCGHVAMQHVNYFNHSLLKHIQRIEGQTDYAMSRMRSSLSHIMSRRTKVERADDLGLPPRVVTVRRDFFNEEEKDLYSSIFSDSRRQFSTYANQGVVSNNYANIFTLITRMRQIADHPDLVLRRAGASNNRAGRADDDADAAVAGFVCKLCDDEAEDAIQSRCHHTFCRLCVREYVESFLGREQDLVCPVCRVGFTIDLSAPALDADSYETNSTVSKGSIINRIDMNDTWRSSTKIEALVEESFKLRSDRQTTKSIVFSQFTSMSDLVEWRSARAGFSTVKLQGNMSPHQRDSIIRHFMETPSVEVFLVSLKAGGVALNSCEASQVFLLDPWWNPSVEWQSGDRVHRIGQHRPVTITRLIIEDSIESRIIELQAKKANMINATIGSDDAALNRSSKDDMEFLFQN